MKKVILLIVAVAMFIALPLSSANASEVFQSRSELIQWDPDKAYNGYNLFTTAGKTWLVDMEGYVVNSWAPVDANARFGHYALFLENGRLRQMNVPDYAPMGVLRSGGVEGRIEEYNWDGERTWWMDVFDGTPVPGEPNEPYTDATYRFHHDMNYMYNSIIGEWTYMVLLWIAKGEADADNLGVDPALNKSSRGTGSTWSPCALIEILPNYAAGQGGDIIWFWTFADHMMTTISAGTATEPWEDWAGRTAQPPLITNAAGLYTNPQKLNVNGVHNTTLESGPRKDMQHCNSIDYDEATGFVCINAKANSEFFVVDHDGTFLPNATANDWDSVGASARTSAGDFVYRFGNPASYDSGKEYPSWGSMNDAEMTGIHDIQFILPYMWRPPFGTGDTWAAPTAEFALPGGGQHPDDIADGSQGEQHFLLFDNACWSPGSPGSYILEIDPYEDGDGAADPTASGFQLAATSGFVDPADLRRRAQVPWSYNAGRRGANDFYSSYISGCSRLPNGNTIIDSGANSHLFEVTEDGDVVWEYVIPQSDDGVFQTTFSGAMGTFRFHRFSSSHPALAGRALTRGNTLTGRIPGTFDQYPESVPITGWGIPPGTASEAGAGAAEAGEGAGGY